ncbi:MAG: ATP-binding cassette domain-containing protein [Methylocella sp.]
MHHLNPKHATAVATETSRALHDAELAGEIIGLDRIGFRYEEELPAILSDITFSVRRGERVLVLGPSGGGKSTLLMILAGLIPRIINGELTGAVRLKGIDTQQTPTSLAAFSASAAIVMQDPESQITCLTVEDEVAFALENFNLTKTEIRDRVEATLKRTRLDAIRDDLVYTLSGGQKQRLAIACALARAPQLIILDEPVSNLDPIGSAEVMPLIDEVARDGASAIVMTAHDYAGFADRFTRVVIVADGKIRRDGQIREVLADVPLLDELGLEVPPYVRWVYDELGASMRSAPLNADQAVEQVALIKGVPSPRPERKPVAKTPASESVVVRLNDLSVAFYKKTVLRNLSCEIRRGEIVALLGYNGSGKSTLALTIAGVLPIAGGAIEVMGEAYRYKRGKRVGPRAPGIGYVFQYPEHQFLYGTAFEEVMHDLDASQSDRGRSLLSSIGIANEGVHPYELSGGEKRRLGVKSAIARPPKLLILDEPTYGQDARNRKLIESDIQTLNDDGTTVIVITHDMDFVRHVATRVLVLRYGELAFDGAPQALFDGTVDLASVGLVAPGSKILEDALIRKHGEATAHVG